MTFRNRIVPLAVVCTAIFMTTSCAAGPRLDMPRFDHLERVATESVNIHIGRLPLALAARFMKDDQHPEFPELLRGLRSVNVRSFEFSKDNMYSQKDVDYVRRQLSAPGWTPVAQIRERQGEGRAENVDVFVAMEDDTIQGLAVIASGPRELTIVSIEGKLDPDMLATLEDRFGLPATGL